MQIEDIVGDALDAVTTVPRVSLSERVDEAVKALVPQAQDVLIGVTLTRGERTGRFIEAIGHDWSATGMAVAIRSNGDVVKANHVFGRWLDAVPTVSPCRRVQCAQCGVVLHAPEAAWRSKEVLPKEARPSRDTPVMTVLRDVGKCPACGASRSWRLARDVEKEELTAFADMVARTMADKEIPMFTPFTPFAVVNGVSQQPLPPEWRWLEEALRKDGRSCSVITQKGWRGTPAIFNPGTWAGRAREIPSSLFFNEAAGFDPRKTDGC